MVLCRRGYDVKHLHVARRAPYHLRMNFQAVLFDCDGVLVDSEAITNGVLRDMLEESGRPRLEGAVPGLKRLHEQDPVHALTQFAVAEFVPIHAVVGVRQFNFVQFSRWQIDAHHKIE